MQDECRIAFVQLNWDSTETTLHPCQVTLPSIISSRISNLSLTINTLFTQTSRFLWRLFLASELPGKIEVRRWCHMRRLIRADLTWTICLQEKP